MSIKRLATFVAASSVAATTSAGIATTTAAPANAIVHYSAIVFSPNNGAWGWAMLATTQQQAVDVAMTYCAESGGTDCQSVAASTANGCVALAANGPKWAGGAGATDAEAQGNALGQIGGGNLLVSTCSGQPFEDAQPTGRGGISPLTAPPAPAPAPAPAPPEAPAQPPEAPKQGPTVTFETAFGGLVAHITDRSGVTSQCTYTADNGFTRSFALNANSTFDLKIVPAVPEFRNWDVTIKCDNGTSTRTTTFF